jgi:hypothetical protein
MTYKSQAELRSSPLFQARWTSAIEEQALIFKDDGRPEFVWLAQQVLRGDFMSRDIWGRILCAAPGFDDRQDQADITDAELLAAVQSQWPTVAQLVPPPPLPYVPPSG